MRYYLIDKLFKILDKDRESIKKILSKSFDELILESNDKYGKMILTIKYEKKVIE